ncbi:hypothetical protein HY213_03045 [Candidatus Peregrinibacteria bacterium]|nr:hypothetical protein [Candidatus Peregrinibacteria bacterium]
MQRECKNCATPFEIAADDLDFYGRVSPVFAGEKFAIPPPTLCPDCRQQRRLAQCNESHFSSATCGLCGAQTLSEHPSHSKKIVYCRECWHSDRWDPCRWGRDVDFSRPMFEQLKELWRDVPAQHLLTAGTNVNSEYIHYAGFAKNCYLIMHSDFCENCYYGYGFKKTVSCVDGFYNMHSELCYDCIDVHGCYGLTGCQDCINCSSSGFLRDCIGCKHCFLCAGLRDKEYCFENQQLSKESYEEKIADIDLGSHMQYEQFRSKRKEMERRHPFKQLHGHNLQDCSGDYLVHCKDTHASFDCEDVEEGKYLYQIVTGAKNNHDIYQYGLNLRESYECAIAGNDSYHVLFCHHAHMNCSDLLYCWFTQSVKNSFGCINMHHKQYCILNTQYTKGEYEKLVPKIIAHMQKTGEWGEFFPVNFSPFGYNKTSAQMYYPVRRDDVLERGWQWDDAPDPPPKVRKIIDPSMLPDSIVDIPDDILEWAITCEASGKLFRITAQELRSYRERRLRIPRRSPHQRHLDRFAQRNPRRFWTRNCMKCAKEMQTTFASEQPEIVYCESCYLATVY